MFQFQMVRLKDADLYVCNQTKILVSIPNGTIKSVFSKPFPVDCIQFQFQMVRLKDMAGEARQSLYTFQFQMVRLKDSFPTRRALTCMRFNSKWYD